MRMHEDKHSPNSYTLFYSYMLFYIVICCIIVICYFMED